jgi:hypothetical protein
MVTVAPGHTLAVNIINPNAKSFSPAMMFTGGPSFLSNPQQKPGVDLR